MWSSAAKGEYRDARIQLEALEAQAAASAAMQLSDATATFGCSADTSAGRQRERNAAGGAQAAVPAAMSEAQAAETPMECYDGPPLTFDNIPDRYWSHI